MKSPVANGNGKGGVAFADPALGKSAAAEIIFPAPEVFDHSAGREIAPILSFDEDGKHEVAPPVAVAARPAAKKEARRKVVLMLLAAVAVAGLTAWLYLGRERQGRVVPAPTSVDHTAHQTTGGL